MADVFISYARKDGAAFVEELAEALKARGKEVWLDRRDIPLATDWREEARAGIEESNSVVYVITRQSVDSDNCLYELAHAEAYNKRIIPVRKDPVEPAELPPSVASLVWVDFTDGTADAYDELERTINRDPDWVTGHTRWLGEALDWDRNRRDKSYLATGAELNEAEAWLTQAEAGSKEPTATPLHYEFILAGRQVAARKQRTFVVVVTLASAFAVALAAIAYVQRNEAVEQRRVAVSRLLASEALGELDRRLDRSLLLAAAAYEVKDTPEARNSVLVALRRCERMLGFLRTDGGPMSSVATRTGGRQLVASGLADGGVRIWSLPERALVRELTGGGAPLAGVAVGRDVVAAVDDGGEVLTWSLESGRRLPERVGVRDVTSLTFLPRGDVLALGLRDGSISLWAPESGVFSRHSEPEGAPITSLSVSNDGTRLAAGSERGLLLLRLGGGRLLRGAVHRDVENSVVDVAFSAGGGRLAAVREDGRVLLWNVAGRKPTSRTLPVAPVPARSVATDASGRLATGYADGSVAVWDPAWRSRTASVDGHGGAVFELAFWREGNDDSLVTASEDGTIVVWSARRKRFRESVDLGHDPPTVLDDVAFVRGGGLVVAGRDLMVMKRAGRALRLGPGPGGRTELAVSADGRLAAGGRDGTLWWDVRGRPAFADAADAGQAGPTTAVAVDADGSIVAEGALDGTIRLSSPTGSPRRTIRTGGGQVLALALAPDDPVLAVASANGTVAVWRVETSDGRVPERLVELRPGTPVDDLAFSPDGTLLAFPSGTDVVVWDLSARKDYGRVTRHDDAVTDVAFAPPDGRVLVSSDVARRVVLWDVSARRAIGEALEEPTAVEAVAFRLDGAALAVGGRNGTVTLWSEALWNADRAHAWICGLVDGKLDEEEREQFVPSGTHVPDPCG